MKNRRWQVPVLIALAVGILLFARALSAAAGLLLNAAVQAYLFFPLVKTLEKRAPRTSAIFLAFALTLAVNITLIMLFIPVLTKQAQTFFELLPQYREKIDNLFAFLKDLPLPADILSFDKAADAFSFSPQAILSFTATSLLLPVLMLYLLRDRERIAALCLFCLPQNWRGPVQDMAKEINRQLRQYITGEGLTMLLVSALTAMLLALFGFPYWLVLGAIMGIMNVIPYIGPLLGSVPIMLVALSEGRVLTALALILVIQQIDNLLIHPRLISGIMRIHPAVVLLVLTAGGAAGSLLGMVLAVPTYIVLRILFREFYRIFTERKRNVPKFEQI
ncbi:MAG: AI-2E family transporter [Clostridia bacterium]|nr:AI-2E family transporter [Clostridia bacterium]